MIYIDIPAGKALAAVETEGYCNCTKDCDAWGIVYPQCCIVCGAGDRKDGKNVIFKLVDYPPDPLERLTAVVKSNDPPLTKEEKAGAFDAENMEEET
jgi:hypothetical protein